MGISEFTIVRAEKSADFHDHWRAAMNLDARIDKFSISRGFSYM